MSEGVNASTVIQFHIENRLNERRAIVATLFLPLAATKQEMDETLDRVMLASDRQEARYLLLDAKLKLENEHRELANAMVALEKYEQQVYAAYRGSSRHMRFNGGGEQVDESDVWKDQNAHNRNVHLTNIQLRRDMIVKLQNDIKEFEQAVKG